MKGSLRWAARTMVMALAAVTLTGLVVPGAPAATAGKMVLGLCLADQEASFSREIKRGAEDAGREWGFSIGVRNAGGHPVVQQNDIAKLQKAGIRGLLVEPVDPVAIAPALAAAARVGVRVVTLVTPVSGVPSLHVRTNYQLAGRLAAGHLRALAKEGSILVVGPSSPASADQAGGFGEALRGTAFKAVRLVVKDRIQAAQAVEDWATKAGSPPAGVFATTMETALGALRGLNAVDGGIAVPVVGFGVDPETRKALTVGRFSALVASGGWDIGHLAAEATLGLLDGTRPATGVVSSDPLLLR